MYPGGNARGMLVCSKMHVYKPIFSRRLYSTWGCTAFEYSSVFQINNNLGFLLLK